MSDSPYPFWMKILEGRCTGRKMNCAVTKPMGAYKFDQEESELKKHLLNPLTSFTLFPLQLIRHHADCYRHF